MRDTRKGMRAWCGVMVVWAVAALPACGDELAGQVREGLGGTQQAVRAAEIAEPCPAPFVRQQIANPKAQPNGNPVCILIEDETLEYSILIDDASHVRLDCQGYTIRPAIPASDSQASDPERAIVVFDSDHIRISDCQVGPADEMFTIGISLLMSEEVSLLSNEVHASLTAIEGFKVNDSRFWRNTLTFRSNAYTGIRLGFGSSNNEITQNHVTGENASDMAAEGGAGCIFVFQQGVSNVPELRANYGLELVNFDVPQPDGVHRIQVPYMSRSDDGTWSEHVGTNNLIEANTLLRESRPPEGTRGSGIEIAQSTQSSRIVGNTIIGTSNGVDLAGEPRGRLVRSPGSCSADHGRLCLTDDDCDSLMESEESSTCMGVGEPQDSPGTQSNNLVEDNILPGPYYVNRNRSGNAIFVSPGQDFATIRGNRIDGRGSSQSFSGMLLMGKALETVTVERNTITGTGAGIRFAQVPNRGFAYIGSTIRLNDIVDNAVNVSIDVGVPMTAPFNASVELSTDGQGNYYGHRCDVDGGFIEAGKPNADSSSPLLMDSAPYGVSVAETPDGALPEPCP